MIVYIIPRPTKKGYAVCGCDASGVAINSTFWHWRCLISIPSGGLSTRDCSFRSSAKLDNCGGGALITYSRKHNILRTPVTLSNPVEAIEEMD